MRKKAVDVAAVVVVAVPVVLQTLTVLQLLLVRPVMNIQINLYNLCGCQLIFLQICTQFDCRFVQNYGRAWARGCRCGATGWHGTNCPT